MLYILLGDDDFSRRQALEEIKAGIGDPALLTTNTTTFDGQQVTPDELITTVQTVPFLAEKRLVIVSGLLERFNPKKRPGRRQKKASNQISNAPLSPERNPSPSRVPGQQQEDYTTFSRFMTAIPDSTVLVLVDGRISAGNPLLKELLPGAKVRHFPLLKGTELQQWIQGRVKAEGSSISSPAVNLLAKLVGSNLWIMASEINKLVLFAAGRRIEAGDVKEIVSHAEEASIFSLVDAVLELKAGVAETLLQRLLERGAAPAYILVMLLRQARMIVQVKELKSQKRSNPEIQHRLGLTSEFALRKTAELAVKYPWIRLKELYRQLLATDLAIKTGKYDGELALNILVAELCLPHRL